ncbi:unnamed protein product, partial [Allacma fusca]
LKRYVFALLGVSAWHAAWQ